MPEVDAHAPEAEPETADLRAEGVAVSRSPRTLFGSVALFAPTAYAAAVVLRDAPHPGWVRATIAVSALAVVTRVSSRLDELGREARVSGRITLGASVVAATLAAGHPGPDVSTIARVAIVLAASIAGAAAGHCASTIPGLGGVAAAPSGPAIAAGAARGSLASWLLSGLAFSTALLPGAHGSALRLPLGAMTIAGALMLLLANGRRRRHELGARERFELLIGGATLALPFAAVVATGLQPFAFWPRPETLLVWPALGLSAAVLLAQLVADPVRAAFRVARAWVVLIAGIVGAFGLLVTAPGSALAGLCLGVGIGLVLDTLASVLGLPGPRLSTQSSTLNRALRRAREASAASDPNEVARGVLASVRALAGESRPAEASPTLLLFSPLREVALDAAGEPRTRSPLPREEAFPDPDAPSPISRVVPTEILRLAVEEPLGVVRAQALRAVEVRRPDLRPALRFLGGRDAAAAVAIVVDGELDGLLLVPEAEHTHELGLAEVRALRTIARLCATRLSLEAALARATARAQRAEHRARDLEHVVERAHHDNARLALAIGSASRPLERGLDASGYAPASRALLAELDALAPSTEHLVLVHRPGTDPLPFLSRLHQKSGRKGALHVVDAGRREGADPARWADPRSSPIELARDGTLGVLGAEALSREAQRRLLSALTFREGPGADPTPVDLRVVLAVTSTDPEHEPLARLHAELDPSLLRHLRRAPLRVLPLSRRIEDLHALCLDRLATLGTALAGKPLGLAPEAFALLVEHPWTGDDLELDDVLARAASAAVTDRALRIETAHVGKLLGPVDAASP